MNAVTSFKDRCIQKSIRGNKALCMIWMNSYMKATTSEKREYIDWLKKSVEANKEKEYDLQIAKRKLKNAIFEYQQAVLNLMECKRIFEKYHA